MTESKSAQLKPATLEGIRAAHERLRDLVPVTPLVPLNVDGVAGEIYLKLENLQPVGSFKLRTAGNFMLGLFLELIKVGGRRFHQRRCAAEITNIQ